MRKTTLIILVAGVLFTSCAGNGKELTVKEAETVEIVSDESTIEYTTVKEGSALDWRASHLGGMQPRFGKIEIQAANLLVNNNQLSNAVITIDMTSFSVDNFGDDEDSKIKLTEHLQGDDFFKITDYPTSTFELTAIEEKKGDYNAVITGNLTILKATKSITFNANVLISENEISIKSEDFSIDRTNWGLIYHTEGTEGVPTDYLIANNIGFTIDVTITKN